MKNHGGGEMVSPQVGMIESVGQPLIRVRPGLPEALPLGMDVGKQRLSFAGYFADFLRVSGERSIRLSLDDFPSQVGMPRVYPIRDTGCHEGRREQHHCSLGTGANTGDDLAETFAKGS